MVLWPIQANSNGSTDVRTPKTDDHNPNALGTIVCIENSSSQLTTSQRSHRLGLN